MMETIIRTFLKKGMLLSRGALAQAMSLENLDDVIKKIPKTLVVQNLSLEPQTTTTTSHTTAKQQSAFLQAVQKVETKIEVHEFAPQLKILKSFQPASQTSVVDIIKQNSMRFEFLRKILAEKFELDNLTTINKLSSFGEASVIGEVRSVDDRVVQLEDTTGSVKVLFEEPQRIFVGDVIGVHGLVRKDFLATKRLVFPDIPLKRSVGTSKRPVKVIVASVSEKNKQIVEKTAAEKNVNYVLNCGDVLSENKNLIHVGDKNSKAEAFEIEGLHIAKISLEDKFAGLGEDGAIEALKRRNVKYGMESFLFESPPDVLYAAGKSSMKNYKGSTVIQCDESKAFIIDLQTREVEEISLG